MAKRSRHGAETTAARSVLPLDVQIRFAIANKRLVELAYHGRVRVAEPHDYGRLNHTTKLLIYQVSTSSDMQKGATKGWRLLEVSDITECVVLEQMFPGSRGESYTRHLPWEIVYSRVG
jgi:hypothetical protein